MSLLHRRSFLAASAGLLAAPLVPAADPKPEFTFALVTDTHLGKPGADYVKRMRQAVTEINASPAACTFFCGDLVDRGEVEANQKRYAEWVDIARGLKSPYLAVPGNHDPHEQFTRHVASSTEGVLAHKNYRFVSFANAELNPGHMGVLTPKQLKWMQGELTEASKKNQRVVLVAHVAYHENKSPDVGWYVKQGRAEFGKVLATNRQIVAYFSGHLHCGMRGWSDNFHGIHEVVLPCVSYNRDRKLENVPGFALREFRPAWVLAEVYPREIVLRYKPVGAEIAASKTLPLAG